MAHGVIMGWSGWVSDLGWEMGGVGVVAQAVECRRSAGAVGDWLGVGWCGWADIRMIWGSGVGLRLIKYIININ